MIFPPFLPYMYLPRYVCFSHRRLGGIVSEQRAFLVEGSHEAKRQEELKRCSVTEEEMIAYVATQPNTIVSLGYKSILRGFKEETEWMLNTPPFTLFSGTMDEYLENGDIHVMYKAGFKKRFGIPEMELLAEKMGCDQSQIKYLIKLDARILLKGADPRYVF